ncbi:glycosyltransferase family 2 protein [Flavobacterium sp. MMLR14_040]|uniref:glycosyltransferase family 2 protein n=1 Tax=Flavobacterium sp. MMLR14_040 TaxID=3093843 RepID=UPI0029907054|nr:glycosyltransferase family 2 protein [Flavobacterium sp. MMLR14_040]MDW8849260.1 glycosyltransferase family 2 protein [Flavobacterium sp. MMLR14_040]
MIITVSVVLYNTNLDDLLKGINSIFQTNLNIKLFLIDNSITDKLREFINDPRTIYIHNPSNPGFGPAHNIAIQKSIEQGAKYHFIVNPDIYFHEDVISPMISFMENDASIGMMMPQILNLDGTVQNLPKLLPSPFDILWRKLKKPQKAYEKFINQYELRQVAKDMIYNAPVLSGCFTLLNLEAIKKVGMYDDKFFMYFEDWDLSRRIHQHYKTIYFPLVSVYHGYDSGANKSSRLFKIFLNSAVTYFNKWGWFLDRERVKINKSALSQFT